MLSLVWNIIISNPPFFNPISKIKSPQGVMDFGMPVGYLIHSIQYFSITSKQFLNSYIIALRLSLMEGLHGKVDKVIFFFALAVKPQCSVKKRPQKKFWKAELLFLRFVFESLAISTQETTCLQVLPTAKKTAIGQIRSWWILFQSHRFILEILFSTKESILNKSLLLTRQIHISSFNKRRTLFSDGKHTAFWFSQREQKFSHAECCSCESQFEGSRHAESCCISTNERGRCRFARVDALRLVPGLTIHTRRNTTVTTQRPFASNGERPTDIDAHCLNERTLDEERPRICEFRQTL